MIIPVIFIWYTQKRRFIHILLFDSIQIPFDFQKIEWDLDRKRENTFTKDNYFFVSKNILFCPFIIPRTN